MMLDWSREKNDVAAPWVGRGVGVTYRIHPDLTEREFRVTVDRAVAGTFVGEVEQGRFATQDLAARFVLQHYADAARSAREAMTRQVKQRLAKEPAA